MALLVTKQNRPVFLSAEKARLLWLVHTGERKGTAENRKKASQIAKWYLNRETAPQSYKDSHPLLPEPNQRRRQLVGQVRLPYID